MEKTKGESGLSPKACWKSAGLERTGTATSFHRTVSLLRILKPFTRFKFDNEMGSSAVIRRGFADCGEEDDDAYA